MFSVKSIRDWSGFVLVLMCLAIATPAFPDVQPGDRNEGRAVLWTDLDPAGVAHMIEVGVEYGAR